MNRDAHSVECAHGFHAACTFEDCACYCHEPCEEDAPPTAELADLEASGWPMY